jgi:hypothetical protein
LRASHQGSECSPGCSISKCTYDRKAGIFALL